MKIFLIIMALVFVVMGVSPYMLLKDMFEQEGLGVIFVAVIILVVWAIISFIIKTKNKYIIQKNKVKEVYIRDIEVDYSPAVLSYLMNNKIETSKDLPATILNLCAKNILKIESIDGKIKIIDLKNKKEVKKIKSDEKYAYDMLVTGVTNSKINTWKNKVEAEYRKYKFSMTNKKSLGIYLFGLYAAIFIGILLYSFITGETEITGRPAEIISRLLIGSFVAAWEILLIYEFKEMFTGIIVRKNENEFGEVYTNKGAREYSKWKKFENFMEDFSLIKEREHESVVIWGKYLSYSIVLGINKKCDKELYSKIEKEYSFDFDSFSKMFENNEEE